MIFKKAKKRIFLDYASITPVDTRVLAEMEKYSGGDFANPSALYGEALAAKEVMESSRGKIADVLNVQKSEIVFTSGGTEGNNLALLGVFEAFKTKEFTPHFITTTIEHPSILEVFKEIERRGGEVTHVPVSSGGIVDPKAIATAVKENTVLVSVMHANNEIGTIQPIKEIARAIKTWKQDYQHNHPSRRNLDVPYFHTDACQAPLYLSIDMLKLGVDMMTLDGIKMYGPRGAGILAVKSNVKINQIVFGGGQERGLRSGTENVPVAAGLAVALEIAEEMRESESERLTEIRDYAIETILKIFPNATLNGSQENRLPNNINICFAASSLKPAIDAEFIVISLDVHGISASYSSSCRTLKEDSSSYVVANLGKEDCSLSSLRFTLGRETTKEDIDSLREVLQKVIQ